MAQALLGGPQRTVPGRDEDQAGGIKAGAGQGGRVQVAVGRDPQHRARAAGQHGCGEQRRGGAMLDSRATGKQLVHRAQGETTARQVRVQLGQAERQVRGRRLGAGSAFERRDLRAQVATMFNCIRHASPRFQAHGLERIVNKRVVKRGF